MDDKKENGQQTTVEEEVLNPDEFDEVEEEEQEADEPESDESTESEDPNSSGKSAEQLAKEKAEKEAKAKRDAHFAKLRREKEAQEKAEKEKREREEREKQIREEAALQAELGLIRSNPYTGEPITDAEDLKIYKLQKEIEDEGGDPINDLPKKIAEKARKAAAEEKKRLEKEERERKAIDEQANREIKELKEKYPDVNLGALAQDELFKECLKGRAGRWTQIEIYEFYLQQKAAKEREEQEALTKDTVEEGAKKITKTPSSRASGKTTSKSVADMTPEEFREYYKEKYGG